MHKEAFAASLPLQTGLRKLEPHENEWMEKLNTLGLAADIDASLGLLASCPLSMANTRICAVIAGCFLGRVLALSPEERARRKKELRRLYALSSNWTIIEPEAFCLFLETVGPEVLYVAVRLWPEEYPNHRIFFATLLWSLYNEKVKSMEFLNKNGALNSLCNIIMEGLTPLRHAEDEDEWAGSHACQVAL